MLIFYLFKTREKVMKITQHTDSGMEKENGGFVSEERNLNTELVRWILLMLFTTVLTQKRSLS